MAPHSAVNSAAEIRISGNHRWIPGSRLANSEAPMWMSASAKWAEPSHPMTKAPMAKKAT